MLVLAVGAVIALVLWTRRRNVVRPVHDWHKTDWQAMRANQRAESKKFLGWCAAIVAIGALFSLAVYFWPQALTW